MRDERLWAFTDSAAPVSMEALAARYRALESERSPDGSQAWLNWVVRAEETQTALGFVQATVHEADRTASIAYVIGSSYWHRGYATRAVAAMLARLDARYAIVTYTASVDERNTHSIALLERAGFERTNESDPHDLIYTLHASKREHDGGRNV